MNKALILLISVALSCGNTASTNLLEPNPVNVENEETDQDDILLGNFEKEDLMEKPYSKWFEPRYEKFNPDENSMAKIAENINDYEIKLFMGTWCADSKREVPKFLKMLDMADFNHENLEMVAVDYDKSTENGIEKELNIEYVPTIIFYKDGKEVNRFVEYPQSETLEEDIAKIVTGEPYKNSYTN
ncbi:thioredoxin [Gramella sp. BOM4]|nr:thioredoxin [Christiangramia bathymodioli]